jgi:choline dehydrogenase-like flavoprotein
MLDGGRVLETSRTHLLERMASTSPEMWTRADRASWTEPQYHTPPGQVRRYGSDFAMEPRGATLAASENAFGLRSSLAVGGLSNLWGSAILPYRSADLADWPISAADLAPHYESLARFLPFAGEADALAGLFPTGPQLSQSRLAASPQGEVLLQRLGTVRSELDALGITAGKARQAVASGCRQCGMCLHGCPWGLIWSARSVIPALQAFPAFSYRSGSIATIFEESDDAVRVTLADRSHIRGTRLFIAAGVLETTRLLLASQPTRGMVTLKDSHHGFLPTLHRWSSPRRPDKAPYHTLPQAFVELDDPAISPYLVHSQLYTWNEFFERDLIASYGKKLPGSAPLWRALARRLIVAQIFLHSDHSAKVSLRLEPNGHLVANVIENAETSTVLKRAGDAIGRGLRAAGLHPLSFALRSNPVGSSFHAGSTVPMAKDPDEAQSDVLGRPHGLSRVHIVDASVLPSIPATTITLSVMANAHRIGTLAP